MPFWLATKIRMILAKSTESSLCPSSRIQEHWGSIQSRWWLATQPPPAMLPSVWRQNTRSRNHRLPTRILGDFFDQYYSTSFKEKISSNRVIFDLTPPTQSCRNDALKCASHERLHIFQTTYLLPVGHQMTWSDKGPSTVEFVCESETTMLSERRCRSTPRNWIRNVILNRVLVQESVRHLLEPLTRSECLWRR